MTRKDYQGLADDFLGEARALFSGGMFGGAYYLAGYAVECALKACVAKRTAEHDFPPDRKFVENCYTHDLVRLVKAADLEDQLQKSIKTDSRLRANWTAVKIWNEASRYQRQDVDKARDLIQAIEDTNHGILPWVKRHW